MSLQVKFLDVLGNTLGNGYAYRVAGFNRQLRLDQIGSFSLTLPKSIALHAEALPITSEIVVYEDYREIYRGIVDGFDDNGTMLLVKGFDLLEELRRVSLGMRWNINYVQLGDFVNTALGYVANTWATNITGQTQQLVGSFNSKSVFDGILAAAKQYGYHIRQNEGARVLEIGTLGESKDYILSNVGLMPRGDRAKWAIIDKPKKSVANGEIVNRLVALGGNYTVGSTSTTLVLDSSLLYLDYQIKQRTRGDGIEYYIEDTPSIGNYGVREAIEVFNDIRPVANENTALQIAKDALKSRAVNYLQRLSTPQTSYSVVAYQFDPGAATIGDKITLQYRDEFTAINEALYIVQMQINYDSEGQVRYELQLSDVDRIVLSDADLITSQLYKIRTMEAQNTQ